MLNERVKHKNSLMEKLYEEVSSRLEGLAGYKKAQGRLTTSFETFMGSKTVLTNTSTCITVPLGGNDHPLIELFLGDDGDYFLTLSPPDHNNNIETQIKLAQDMIAHLNRLPPL